MQKAVAVVLAAASAALTAGEPTLLQRTRIHLASLIRNGDHVGGAAMRAHATALIQELPEGESAPGNRAFANRFEAAYGEIFPMGRRDNLTAFRRDASALLADMDDALPILTTPQQTLALRAAIADLQSRLSLVSDSASLGGWIARYDAFVLALKPHADAIPSDPTLLRHDLGALLSRLSDSVRHLHEAGIETGNMRSQVAQLRREVESVETDEDIDRVLGKLEELLTIVPNSR